MNPLGSLFHAALAASAGEKAAVCPVDCRFVEGELVCTLNGEEPVLRYLRRNPLAALCTGRIRLNAIVLHIESRPDGMARIRLRPILQETNRSDFALGGMTMETLRIKRLTKTALLPCRATLGSAGYDLCADEEAVIPPGETLRIKTGIAIGITDPGVAAFIYARSGLAAKYGVAPANCVGVIDSDYRGEIQVPLFNHGSSPFPIRPGDRIAQLVLAPVYTPAFLEVDSLDETDRGAGGFGSTGV